MTLNHISIISVPVSDQTRAKEFYQDVLKFEIIHDDPIDDDRRWIQLALPNTKTSIALVHWFDKMPAGCLQGLVINTSDIDKAVSDLKRRKLKVTDIERMPWGDFAMFDDPDGNGWILQQEPEGN